VSRWLVRHKQIGRWQGRFVGMIYITLGIRLAIEER
jgi:threonine/homoserine/homoserine lactone efflux protein